MVPPSRLTRADAEVSVQEKETTHVPFTHPSARESIRPDVPVASVEPEASAQNAHASHDNAEPPKRTRSDDDDHSAPVCGTRMPDMSGSAWLAITTKTGTQKSEPTTDAKSKPSKKNVDNLLVTISFSLDEETTQKICSGPNPETLKVKWRRAEQSGGCQKRKKRNSMHLSSILQFRRHRVKGSHRLL